MTQRARGALLVLGTVLAMLVAAGIGALVAAHSRSRDAPAGLGATGGPGVTPTNPTPPPTPPAQTWNAVMRSATTHYYRTGGTCSTSWRTHLALSVDAEGVVSGTGEAQLVSGPRCPFPTTQPQIKRYDFTARGDEKGKRLTFKLIGNRVSGSSGVEYGGFELTVVDHPRTVTVAVHGNGGRAHFVARYSGVAGEDQSRSTNTILLAPGTD